MADSGVADKFSNAEVVFINECIAARKHGISYDNDIIGRIALSCGLNEGQRMIEREDIREAIERGEILHKVVPAVGLILTTDNLGVGSDQAAYIEYAMSQAILQAAANGIDITNDPEEVKRHMMEARTRARKELGLE